MKKKLLNNLGLKLLSVVAAIVVWFVAIMVGNPRESTSFSNIQVTSINTELLENENKVYEILDHSDVVRVTVEAPRDLIDKIQASDIVATADVSKLTEVNTIAIEYTMTEDVGILGISGNHDVVRLSVEERATKWVNVDCEATGNVAEGYMVNNITSDQTRIEVSGPKSAVEKISKAVVEVNVKDATNNVSINADVHLYDAEGNMLNLPNVEKPNVMRVEAQILATKEVPIEWNPMGVPAEGYLATGVVEYSSPTVLIAGTVSALSNISKITLPETELDITGATGDVVKDINMRRYLPDDVILADGSFNVKITATVYIEPRADKTLTVPAANITVQNVPDGFEWELLEQAYRVRISGLNADVSAVDQNALQGVLDIAEWMKQNDMRELTSGTYDIPVSFDIAQNVNINNEVVAHIVISEAEEEE